MCAGEVSGMFVGTCLAPGSLLLGGSGQSCKGCLGFPQK